MARSNDRILQTAKNAISLLSFKRNVGLDARLVEWGRIYDYLRPHGAHNGKTRFEAPAGR